MILFGSDYDGTLKRTAVDADDIAAINSFRAAGNLFGIVTGRSYSMIEPEVRRLNIGVDFLLPDNGGCMMLGTGEVVYQDPLPEQTLRKLIAWLVKAKVDLFGVESVSSHFSWGRVDKMPADFDYHDGVPYTLDDIRRDGAVVSMYVRTNVYERTAEVEKRMRREFGREVALNFNNGCINVNALGVNKSYGLSRAQKYFGADTVYAIGDDFNDVEMLRDFPSFAVASGRDEAKAVCDHVVATHREAIDLIAGERKGSKLCI